MGARAGCGFGATPDVRASNWCQHGVVDTLRRRSRALVLVVCIVQIAVLAVGTYWNRGVGAPAEAWIIVAALFSAMATGAVVAVAQPTHPVGWLFLGLSGAMIVSAGVDQFTSVRVLDEGRQDAF